MMEWISVKDRLPNENINVLVCTERYHTLVASYRSKKTVEGFNWVDADGEMFKWVTHWMPLPKPPKE